MDKVLTNTTPGPRGPSSGVGPGHLCFMRLLGGPHGLDTQLGGCGALLFSIKSVPDPVEPELR